MARKLKVTEHKLLWIMGKEKISENLDFHKTIKIGTTLHKRYSAICLAKLREALANPDINKAYQNRNIRAV